MLHLPLLRRGRPYCSAERAPLRALGSGEPLVEVSQANPGLIRWDLLRAAESRRALDGVPAAALLAICRRAGRLFAEAALPLDGAEQSPADYLAQVSATTGLPLALCRENLGKIRYVLEHAEVVLAGLTRGLDLAALDRGWALEDGRPVAYLRRADVLGVVLPSNSPGVHGLWLPALALKSPVALRPGAREPWTPYRAAQALLQAGLPPEGVSFYPSGHAGATETLLACGRSLLFGDRSTVAPWRDDPRVEVHGPGWSKVILGADQVARWECHLDVIVTSVLANGGRSCVNASGLWLARAQPPRGREIAEALAARLAAVGPRPLDDPEARLAAIEPAAAARLSEFLDRHLAAGGAEDLTARFRGKGRVAFSGNLAFVLPTVVWCEGPSHPLASTELPFPFVSVVELPADELVRRLGPSLAVTALTEDPGLSRALLESRAIDRLNLGPVPTCEVAWDQPHEGNLFEHLYRRRALQGVGGDVAAGSA